MDTGLDENESVLAVNVLAGSLEMLADGDGLLDEMVQILWELWGHSLGLEDTEDLVSGETADLSDSVGIPEDDSDLGWAKTLLSHLDDLVLDLLGGHLLP